MQRVRHESWGWIKEFLDCFLTLLTIFKALRDICKRLRETFIDFDRWQVSML